MRALVLGAGMVGSVMAADLSRDQDFAVSIADARPEALARAAERCRLIARRDLKAIQADLSNPYEVARLIAGVDIVLGALSSRLGFQTLRTVIEAGRHYCDISFMAEDATQLSSLAKDKGVTAVFDMGVAPGMSNLLAAAVAREFARCDSLSIYVGGLPRERRWPYQYKAAFSPADVIEEYTRPTRLVENHRVVTRPALSEPELLDFPGVGTLEAFNTDGLRSLADSLSPAHAGPNAVPNMKEKTLRYPGHIDLMRAMRETGLFSRDPIRVNGTDVVPLDLTSALLFPKWTYEPGEEDLTVMRIIGEGTTPAGQRQRTTWDLFDLFDKPSNCTSMSRTTAFPATIVARLIASGRISARGVLPPEALASDPSIVDHLITQLKERGVRYTKRSESIA